jgi:hypothetical protein
VRPAGTAASSPPTPVGPITPVSTPSSPTSNAALAAGVPRPFDNDLRIGNPRSNPATGGWAGQGAATGGELSGAVLRRPEPAGTEPVSQRGPTPVSSGGPVSGSPATTYEQLQAQLAALGVLWQRQELNSETGEWKFSCLVPNRQNPKVRRMYEARARDYLATVRSVLEQIEKEQ